MKTQERLVCKQPGCAQEIGRLPGPGRQRSYCDDHKPRKYGKTALRAANRAGRLFKWAPKAPVVRNAAMLVRSVPVKPLAPAKAPARKPTTLRLVVKGLPVDSGETIALIVQTHLRTLTGSATLTVALPAPDPSRVKPGFIRQCRMCGVDILAKNRNKELSSTSVNLRTG
jgi:hypothetical protein